MSDQANANTQGTIKTKWHLIYTSDSPIVSTYASLPILMNTDYKDAG